MGVRGVQQTQTKEIGQKEEIHLDKSMPKWHLFSDLLENMGTDSGKIDTKQYQNKRDWKILKSVLFCFM